MGISDELRDLAATPPEATAMSASLADQAVGFAIKARRVARMKIAAAVTAGAIATTGVAIGVVTSNDNSNLPVSTPVVTITPSSASPSQSSSASPSSSPSQSESPEQSASPSDAPTLVQPSQPELEPTGPGTDPNILEEILETLRSLPERFLEIFRPDSSSEPEPSTSETPADDNPSPAPTDTPDPRTPEPPATDSPSPTPSSAESSNESPSAPTSSATPSPEPSDPICKVREKRRGPNGEYYPQPEREVECERYREDLDKAKESSSPAESPSGLDRVCTVIEEQGGKVTAEATVPCGGTA